MFAWVRASLGQLRCTMYNIIIKNTKYVMLILTLF